MIEKIRKFIEKYHLIEDGERILIGLSGGADSVCLLLVLRELYSEKRLLALHVNHGLRGKEAERDEHFVSLLCEKLRIELLICRADVGKLAKEEKRSVEEAGRLIRYRFFREKAEENACAKIAVAHNREDVAETFFLNLARGSSLAGLTGIKEKNGEIIRPLLGVSRQEIEAFLQEKNETFMTDATNFSSDYTRNVIRNEVFPILKEKVNKETVSHILSVIETLREAEDFLGNEAEKLFSEYVKKEKHCIYIDNKISHIPPFFQKKLIYRCLTELAKKKQDILSVHVEDIRTLFEKQVGKKADLPYRMEGMRTYDGVLIRKKEEERTNLCLPELRIETEKLADIESIETEGYNIILTLKDGKVKKLRQSGCTRWFDYDRITETVLVRTRKSGDFITISADGKKKKLKAYFIDEKIPKEMREKLPLVAAGSEILWICGRRMGEGARIHLGTKKLLKISLLNMEEEL